MAETLAARLGGPVSSEEARRYQHVHLSRSQIIERGQQICALQIVNLLTSNPQLNDGVALFHESSCG